MNVWEDVERAALHEAVLQRAVTLVRIGHLTREEALIEAVLMLTKIKRIQHEKLVTLYMNQPASIFIPRKE